MNKNGFFVSLIALEIPNADWLAWRKLGILNLYKGQRRSIRFDLNRPTRGCVGSAVKVHLKEKLGAKAVYRETRGLAVTRCLIPDSNGFLTFFKMFAIS